MINNLKLTPFKQKGATVWVMMFIMALVIVVALLVMKVGPIYLNNYQIKGILSGLAEMPDAQKMSTASLKSAFDKRVNINGLTNITSKDLKIKSEKTGKTASVKYDVTEKLVGNLSVFVEFDDTVVLGGK